MSAIEDLGETQEEGFQESRANEVSMEEIIFWAGLATGMEARRQLDEASGSLSQAGEKLYAYALVFAYSLREAMVELTLQELEG